MGLRSAAKALDRYFSSEEYLRGILSDDDVFGRIKMHSAAIDSTIASINKMMNEIDETTNQVMSLIKNENEVNQMVTEALFDDQKKSKKAALRVVQ